MARSASEPQKQVHSIKETCAATGKCYKTIYRACKNGKIRAIRLGGSIAIPSAELRRICEKGF